MTRRSRPLRPRGLNCQGEASRAPSFWAAEAAGATRPMFPALLCLQSGPQAGALLSAIASKLGLTLNPATLLCGPPTSPAPPVGLRPGALRWPGAGGLWPPRPRLGGSWGCVPPIGPPGPPGADPRTGLGAGQLGAFAKLCAAT